MANTSIYAAFERMWVHVSNAISDTVRTFHVTVTGNETSGYTANKTFAEISQAHASGSILYCLLPDENMMMPLLVADTTEVFTFSATGGFQGAVVTIRNDNTVSFEVFTLEETTKADIDVLLD